LAIKESLANYQLFYEMVTRNTWELFVPAHSKAGRWLGNVNIECSITPVTGGFFFGFGQSGGAIAEIKGSDGTDVVNAVKTVTGGVGPWAFSVTITNKDTGVQAKNSTRVLFVLSNKDGKKSLTRLTDGNPLDDCDERALKKFPLVADYTEKCSVPLTDIQPNGAEGKVFCSTWPIVYASLAISDCVTDVSNPKETQDAIEQGMKTEEILQFVRNYTCYQWQFMVNNRLIEYKYATPIYKIDLATNGDPLIQQLDRVGFPLPPLLSTSKAVLTEQERTDASLQRRAEYDYGLWKYYCAQILRHAYVASNADIFSESKTQGGAIWQNQMIEAQKWFQSTDNVQWIVKTCDAVSLLIIIGPFDEKQKQVNRDEEIASIYPLLMETRDGHTASMWMCLKWMRMLIHLHTFSMKTKKAETLKESTLIKTFGGFIDQAILAADPLLRRLPTFTTYYQVLQQRDACSQWLSVYASQWRASPFF